ncbi:MAG: putative aminoacid/polyamine transporter, permease protein [Rhodospirillales bacterium]|nr:putative aminoacid/polyamine transporter, permease protein [Rhodospirillales bacterium]
MSLLDILLGRRLANREYETRKLGVLEGVPAMGLDGLGSSAYGPEAALTVLMPLGAGSLDYIGWVMAPILVLLAILFASYWQTIRAYPSNGGAYVVAKENMGRDAGLLAAGALMIDYVLNVAVGISAGVAALVSLLPGLHPYILPLCLGILALLTLLNLRGTIEAGWFLALPTYGFIACFAIVLALGVYRAMLSGGNPAAIVPPAALPQAGVAFGLWLVLRAFAAGCTAMTGVEAVSNSMSAFRDPPVVHGHRTLAAIVAILAVLLAGIAYLTAVYRIGALDQTQDGYRSVLAQLFGAVLGQGVWYQLSLGCVICVLVFSANTSFVGFPRLCRMVAEDGFLPKPFAMAGRRLVFSVGILYLAGAAGLLLLVFSGITDRLIPLFAIGAFLTFTLSQTGMVMHWRRTEGARLNFWINTIGAAATGAALLVIVVAKFGEGAWITILIIPCVIALLKSIQHYYRELQAQLRPPEPLKIERSEPPVVLVATEDWNRLTEQALRLALALSPDVIAIHLSHLSGPEAVEHDDGLRRRWADEVEAPTAAAGLVPPRLLLLPAQYRAMHEPVLKLVQELQPRFEGRRIAVLIPEIVKQRWYQHFLHARRARHLRAQLLRHGGTRLTVISVPWYLDAVQTGLEDPAPPAR